MKPEEELLAVLRRHYGTLFPAVQQAVHAAIFQAAQAERERLLAAVLKTEKSSSEESYQKACRDMRRWLDTLRIL